MFFHFLSVADNFLSIFSYKTYEFTNEMVSNNSIVPLLKSIENREKVLVAFINTTPYTVEILWINFEGQAVKYAVLDSHKACGINTYVTHPWIFMEKETGDR